MKTTIYYTAKEGRRNACGHTTTRGNAYVVKDGELQFIGDYVHKSGGAGIEREILDLAANRGIGTNGGYFKDWRDAVELVRL